jgi:hypothetical protein
MVYDDKAHRYEHQVKVRLDDEVFQELKDVARDMKLQHIHRNLRRELAVVAYSR